MGEADAMIDFPASPTVGQTFSAAGVTWTWDGAKWTATGITGGPFLPLVGGTMAGELVLHADPVNPLDAATKEYVDAKVAAGGPFLPLTGGTITGNLNLASSNPVINFNKPSGSGGTLAYLAGETNGVTRWVIEPNNPDAETGNNAGANFAILNFSDSGVQLGTPLFINRATGQVTLSNLSAPQAIGDNRLINGDMSVSQRWGSAAVTAFGYTVDRWNVSCNIALPMKVNIQQNLSGFGPLSYFSYALSVQSNSAYTPAATEYLTIYQPLESGMTADLNWGSNSLGPAQPVTLSFWLKVVGGGTFSGVIKNYAQTRSYPFTFTVPNNNSFNFFSITIPPDTGTGAGSWVNNGSSAGSMYVAFCLAAGANYLSPAGAWVTGNMAGATGTANLLAASGGGFHLTGVKLEVGSVATPWRWETMSKRLADCQRYYQILNGIGIVCLANGSYFGMNVSQPFPTLMRAVPTVAYSNVTPGGSFAGSVAASLLTANGYSTVPSGAQTSASAFVQWLASMTAEL
jgi:hypothetical protein